jgi:hypothetical protein
MIPVRRLRAAAAMGAAGRDGGGASRHGRPRRAGQEHRGDWWELDELGTTLRAQPSGTTLRLGDPIRVRVIRVDAPRGRVDLEPAEADAPA